jgi:hypothetical protein
MTTGPSPIHRVAASRFSPMTNQRGSTRHRKRPLQRLRSASPHCGISSRRQNAPTTTRSSPSVRGKALSASMAASPPWLPTPRQSPPRRITIPHRQQQRPPQKQPPQQKHGQQRGRAAAGYSRQQGWSAATGCSPAINASLPSPDWNILPATPSPTREREATHAPRKVAPVATRGGTTWCNTSASCMA